MPNTYVSVYLCNLRSHAVQFSGHKASTTCRGPGCGTMVQGAQYSVFQKTLCWGRESRVQRWPQSNRCVLEKLLWQKLREER